MAVFVIASKYDCQGLGEMAEKCFTAVLLQLDAIDTLRLWRAAYEEGGDMGGWRSRFREVEKARGVAWVRDLVKDHAEELPQLSVDLLRLRGVMECQSRCGRVEECTLSEFNV